MGLFDCLKPRNKKHPKVLFICKKNETYGFTTYTRKSGGLFNSTSFACRGLAARGIHCAIIEVIDNNCIDKHVAAFKPDIVIIEALWVVPEKFDILKKLHPNVKWFIHMHSGLPFLAIEGIAMEWLPAYTNRGLGVIANSSETYEAFKVILPHSQVFFLPNVYLPKFHEKDLFDTHEDVVKVVCGGAVRPMKNHLTQALAAIEFARQIGKTMHFFINGTRVETMGEPVLKNLRSLFESYHGCAALIELPWHEPEEWVGLLTHMDIGMQVSMTETFNVVTADYLSAGLPVVVSREVKWVSEASWAMDDSVSDIVEKMHAAYKNSYLVRRNQNLLIKNSQNAQKAWYKFTQVV